MKCNLCKRDVGVTTRHHLIPVALHLNKKIRKMYSLGELKSRVINVCEPCRVQIHGVFTEKELGTIYNTLEKLLAHPEIIKFVAWIGKKPDGTRVKM